jgi:hypothetical protein
LVKKTKPSGPALFNSTVRALGRSFVLVATTMAVGSGNTPSSFAVNASASQASKRSIGSAGAADSSRWSLR